MITSGFFDATTYDPETEKWDKEYSSNQFMELFSLFFKSGIFADYGDEFAVLAGTGMSVTVSSGFAFIGGAWMKNDDDYSITVESNSTSSTRTDGIFLQKNIISGECVIAYRQANTTPQSSNTVEELLVATITVAPGTTSITQQMITDMRPTEYCGFVAGAVQQLSVSELYAQFGAQFAEWLTDKQTEFGEWFNEMKDQLSEDAAGHLQLEIDDLSEELESTAEALDGRIDAVSLAISQLISWDETTRTLVINLES